jgi:hypothetical protein
VEVQGGELLRAGTANSRDIAKHDADIKRMANKGRAIILNARSCQITVDRQPVARGGRNEIGGCTWARAANQGNSRDEERQSGDSRMQMDEPAASQPPTC